MCQKRVCVAHYSATGGTAVRESSGLKPKNKNYKILVYLLFHSCWLRVRNKSFRIRIHKTDFPSPGTIKKKNSLLLEATTSFGRTTRMRWPCGSWWPTPPSPTRSSGWRERATSPSSTPRIRPGWYRYSLYYTLFLVMYGTGSELFLEVTGILIYYW